MNSRGTLINHRISGETLASSDRVAMTPTVQPAVAGTQRYRELDRLLGWGPERGVASVTDREDIPSTREIPGEAPRVRKSKFLGLSDWANASQTPVWRQKCRKTPHGC